jgi:hypothetical protein
MLYPSAQTSPFMVLIKPMRTRSSAITALYNHTISAYRQPRTLAKYVESPGLSIAARKVSFPNL